MRENRAQREMVRNVRRTRWPVAEMIGLRGGSKGAAAPFALVAAQRRRSFGPAEL
jgi:hypothetical protein